MVLEIKDMLDLYQNDISISKSMPVYKVFNIRKF